MSEVNAATELRGMPVVNSMLETIKKDIEKLESKSIVPTLCVVRVGAREDDLAYERGIIKRFSAAGARVNVMELPEDVTQEYMEKTIVSLNEDNSVHGILVFRPLPRQLSQERLNALIAPQKDVDCMGYINTAYVFSCDKRAYPPCTAQAVVELLDFYGFDLTGKKVTIVGRSMVVGKPLSALLLAKNATVTVCHTKTAELENECRNADIIVACAGKAKMITADFMCEGQTVIDVGINMLDGKLCGDVDYAAALPIVSAVTPVPGGVGTVTTCVLLKHTVRSAGLM